MYHAITLVVLAVGAAVAIAVRKHKKQQVKAIEAVEAQNRG